MMAGPPKTKRNISKNFKNPPQPHMCIQDYITGSSIPCYINILSWEKVNLPDNPSQPVPMRGGMELNPPRNEDKNSRVFAVIANPEVLRIRGKNAKDQNDQSNLIEMLLNFVESKNKGVIFSRIYSILKDRDITGELKEVWNLIQSQESQVETWIDGQPSSSQYSQHLDQQQQQQQSQQQQQQQQQQPQQLQSQQPPQQISQQIPQQIQQQQQMQQTQHMIQNSYMMSQPPQYQSSVIYGPVSNNDCSNYDRYNYPQQSSVSVNQNDQVYQTNQILTLVNRSRVDPDRFSYHERGRLLPQQSFNKMHLPLPQQQQQQQNCPAYSAPQYHYQQISRHMMHYMNSNVNSNYNSQLNPVVNTHFADYMIMQQQHMTSRMEQRQMENQIHADVHRMQHQQQQEQMHMQPTHIQQPVPHYQTHGLNVVANSPMKSGKRGFGVSKSQHAIGPHKNNLGKRQNNSPTHPKQTYSLTGGTGVPQSRDSSGDNATKPKSPVKVLQRDPTLQNRQKVSQFSPEKNSKILEKNVDENREACNIQVTDLDEDETKIKDISELTNAIAFKETEVLNYNILTREAKERIEYKQETKTQKTDGSTLHGEHPVRELREKCRHNEKQRSIKTVLKRNKSCANDVKVWAKDLKGPKNGIRSHFGQINLSGVEKLQDRGTDEHLKGVQQTLAEIDEGWNVRVKHKSSDSPKRAQSTVNSIIKSVFKINQGNNIAGDEVGTGKKQKSNGQVRANTKIAINQHEETNQGCTILKNSEGTTSTTMTVNTPEEVTNEIAQLKIQDCKGSAEKNAVFSL